MSLVFVSPLRSCPVHESKSKRAPSKSQCNIWIVAAASASGCLLNLFQTGHCIDLCISYRIVACLLGSSGPHSASSTACTRVHNSGCCRECKPSRCTSGSMSSMPSKAVGRRPSVDYLARLGVSPGLPKNLWCYPRTKITPVPSLQPEPLL